jgi:hypothetical protein
MAEGLIILFESNIYKKTSSKSFHLFEPKYQIFYKSLK